LDEARELAETNIKLLAPYAREGIPIVGCEPSCMAMLVNEYPDLLPGEDAQIVATKTQLIDEFLVNEFKKGAIQLPELNGVLHVLYHGHCQQKAIFGTSSTYDLLSHIPNCVVEEIESGCCGMAGSFGYENEHYDLSIKLAEMSLAPAIRNAPSSTIVCASGTSCRDQIEHTTGRKSFHPIEVLAEVLFGDGTGISPFKGS
jgi:Fe-S oxidoreductase